MGMVSRAIALAAILAVLGASKPSSAATNYSDLWWNPLESGWGLTIVDHQTQMFAVWYTYRADGSPTWFVLPGGTISSDHRMFSGDLYQTSGPPFTDSFDPTQVTVTKVGSATLDFAPPALAAGSALFSYSIGGVSGSKQLQRQSFGDAPAAWGTDLTDIYWDPAQSGWGLTISQHGSNLFAVWYTYDTSRRPLFVVMPSATFNSDGSFSGDLYTTTGPYYASPVFDPSQVQVTKVGNATMVMDPVATAASEAKSGPLCRSSFLGCKVGKYNPCLHGGCYSKWISPQPFGYAAPDTPGPACEILYNEWSACVGGTQTRTERIRVPQGCAGDPDLQRACDSTGTPATCNYTYGPPYGACIAGQRTHTVLNASPPGCTGTPVPTEACTASTACTSVTYSDWGPCQPDDTQTRVVTSTFPPGCTFTPVTVQACTYSGGGSGTVFNGTFAGSYTITVTVFGPYGGTQTVTGALSVVIVNGNVTVNGTPAGSITSTGSINWSGSGSVDNCTWAGTMTTAGGGGTVHCGEPDVFVADGTWSLSRTQ